MQIVIVCIRLYSHTVIPSDTHNIFAVTMMYQERLSGLVSGCPCDISGFAEHESGGRVKIDVIKRDPFSLDAIKTAVCPEATVTPESRVLLEAGTTPVAAFSSLFHCSLYRQ